MLAWSVHTVTGEDDGRLYFFIEGKMKTNKLIVCF